MDGLKQVTLIKSAKFDFASVNVEGNSLFIGANGAGKTTLLRAILYFYTASSHGLGINSAKKISFSDYYFEYENSYIVYVYKKDEKYVLVTAYKDGSVKFRFTLFDTMPNIKEIFIEDSKPIELANLWIRLKELGVCSNIIQNGAKYKEVLYSKNHKEKMFSLFEAKDYESFTKTLSNIFINSKVDSDAIKKVIVSSLGINSNIDLAQVQRYLKGFNTLYEDIKSYESNTMHIKKIIELLDEYEKTCGLLQDDISTLCNSKQFAKTELESLSIKKQTLEDLRVQNQEKLKYEQNLYQKRKDKLYQSKGAIDSFIKISNEKEEFYERQNIKEKINLYESINIKQKELDNLYEKKDFLTKEFANLHKEHELKLQTINNSYESSKNSIESKISMQQSLQNKEIEKLNQNQSKELEEINEIYTNKKLKTKDEQSIVNTKIQEINFNLVQTKQKSFVYEDEHHILKYNKDIQTIQNTQESLKKELELLDKDIQKENQNFANIEQNMQKKYIAKESELNKQIQNLENILYPSKDSLINKIYEHSKQPQKYLYFLKDEILKDNLDVEFKKDSNQIFEIEPDIEIKQSNLEQSLQVLKTNLTKLEKSYLKDMQKLQKEQKSFEQKIYKEKIAINEQIKALDIKLSTSKTKLSTLKEQKITKQKLFEEFKSNEIQKLEKQLSVLKEQLQKSIKLLDSFEKQKENDKKAKKSYYTKLISKILSEYEPKIKNLQSELENIKELKKSQQKEQEKIYHSLLDKNSVDVNELKRVAENILKLEQNINTIKGYAELIFGYKKDKSEYFDKLDIKTKELKELKKDIEELSRKFELLQTNINTTLIDLNEQLNLVQNEYKDKEYSLKRVDEFENSTTFNELIKQGIKYISNTHNEDIVMLINRIDNTASRYRNYYAKVQQNLSKLNSIFDNSLNINRELDALDTAYKLKEYHQSQKIENTKSLLTQNLNQILKSIVEQYDKLLESQGKIESLIKKITKIFEEIKIGVIDTLSLRYLKTNNKIIETFSAIKEENEQNSLSFFSDSLFSMEDNSKTIIELLKKLIDLIEFEKSTQIDIEDSFILEFRVVENGNDSKYVSSLDMIGSNGTDVLVKSMIYVAMLHIFKQKLTKKELSFQVILDEVGILSQRYLKELIEFANKKAIVFVNGAPDEKLIGTYKQVSLISKVDKISVVKELIVK